mmetsp:Transcript_12770/g.14656  ORF Transcript_12770/g.14656 Transcript_12770/m.14656 type:complete len:280 (+) Transcript_12770:111-950(+)
MSCARVVKVLLFKAEKGQECFDNSDTVENQGKGEVDQYALELRKHDFKVFFSPVLSYRIVVESCKRFVKQLQEKSVSAVALTSPRAADALSWALRDSHGSKEFLVGISWYVVGEETARRLKRIIGVDNVSGSNSGSAADLGNEIIQHGVKSVSFLCGNKRRDVLPNLLKAKEVLCEEFCVYESYVNDEVSIPVEYVDNEVPCDFWCVFFSPSGVKSMSSKSNFAKLVGLSINCLAIGATTASEIQQDKYRDMWKLQAIARKPSPGGVLRALEEYYKSLS